MSASRFGALPLAIRVRPGSPTPDRLAIRQLRLCDLSASYHPKLAEQRGTGITLGCFQFNYMSTREELMKIATLLSLAAALGLESAALAAPYDQLAAKGYRWVTIDGPYACPSKDDLRQIIKHRPGDTVIERLRAYYLIEGAIVQVVQEDAATGMSKIHSAEIGPDVWTLTTFLSKRPIKNIDGEIEVPQRSLAPHT